MGGKHTIGMYKFVLNDMGFCNKNNWDEMVLTILLKIIYYKKCIHRSESDIMAARKYQYCYYIWL